MCLRLNINFLTEARVNESLGNLNLAGLFPIIATLSHLTMVEFKQTF